METNRVIPLPTREEPQLESAIHALDMEEAVLGGILFDPLAITRVVDILPLPEVFYSGAHQEIYRAMLALSQVGQPTDLMAVHQWLSDRSLLERIGGRKKLISLVDLTVGTAATDQYAEVVLEKYRRRQLRQVGNELLGLAADQTQPLGQLLELAEQKLLALSGGGVQQDTLRDLSDFAREELLKAEQVQQGLAPVATPTGFYDLDSMLQGGLRGGQLVIVAGRPGSGKTAFASNTMLQMAKTGVPAILFSLEMDGGAIARRVLSLMVRIEAGRLAAGRVSNEEWGALSYAYSHLGELQIKVDDNQSVTPSQVRSQCRRVKAQFGLGLIVVDYLHLMLDSSSDNEVREIGQVTRQFKKLARELDCPVVLLSQLSRAVENRQNKRPMMSDLRASGAIEQDADIILFLYRDEYYNPDTPDRGIAEIIIGKQREGPTGMVKLLFEPQFTQFRNLARGY